MFKMFKRYQKSFKRLEENCCCGGKFTLVNLELSDGDRLYISCDSPNCPEYTIADRITKTIRLEGVNPLCC
jgi:hypothetical protein